MIQRIGKRQLHELTDEQKKNLRDWWTPENGDYVLNTFDIVTFMNVPGLDEPVREALKEHCLPLLNVGQLFEFIIDKTQRFPHIVNDFETGKRLVIVNDTAYDNENFIDCLWLAAKNLL